MKLGPVAKLEKKNKRTSKNFDDDVMSKNFNVIAIFPIHSQFGGIWRLDSERIVCKTYVFSLIVTFHLTKSENKTKKSLTQLSHYCYEKRYYFGQKR